MKCDTYFTLIQSGIQSHWAGIRDMEIEHLDLEKLLENLEQSNRTSLQDRIIQSGLAHARGFPLVVPCVDLVVSFSKRYNLVTQEIRVEDRMVIA